MNTLNSVNGIYSTIYMTSNGGGTYKLYSYIHVVWSILLPLTPPNKP